MRTAAAVNREVADGADVVFRDTESAALLIADWSRPCVVTVFSIHKAARVYRITLLLFTAEVFYLHF